jgi:predicted Zn-dependent protease
VSTRRAKLIGVFWLVAVGAVATAFAGGLPLLAHTVPFATERKIAAAADFHPPEAPCTNAAGEQALHKLVARLYPLEPGDDKIQIHVQAIHSAKVNAFAVLGGDIYVNQGLIEQAESPEELAGVIAHEIEHVRHRHVLENVMVRIGGWGTLALVFGDTTSLANLAPIMLSLQYTRGQEHQADADGIKRLVQAQVSVKGFEDFFERMRRRDPGRSEYFSDHPSDASRAALAAQYVGRTSRPVLSAGEWKALQNICQ